MIPWMPPGPVKSQCKSVKSVKQGDLVRYARDHIKGRIGIVVDVHWPHGLDSWPWATVMWGNDVGQPISMRGFEVVKK